MKRGLIIATSVIGAALLIALVVVSEIEDVPRNETIRNVGIMLAGLTGLGLGYWRSVIADEQRALRERGLVIDRFNKGVENLGSEKQAVRIGGIYALWQLIEEIPGQDKTQQKSNVKMIVETLTEFARSYEHEASEEKSPHSRMPKDLQNVIQLLGQVDAPYRKIMDEDYKIDLESADLRGGTLRDIDLSNAFAKFVDLSGSVLDRANLSGASMRDAKFEYATLYESNCQGAVFAHAHFERAFLVSANFEGANFWGADIVNTNFYNANLRNAMFRYADFGHENSTRKLSINKDISLAYADITGADFRDAKGLTQKLIDHAMCDSGNPPKLPDGLNPPTRTPEDIIGRTPEDVEKN